MFVRTEYHHSFCVIKDVTKLIDIPECNNCQKCIKICYGNLCEKHRLPVCTKTLINKKRCTKPIFKNGLCRLHYTLSTAPKDKKRRCEFVDDKKERCTKMAFNGDKFCYMHNDD
jgi:hypothetical protein